jgi:hypothetical protein
MRCHSLPIFFTAHIKTQIAGAISQYSGGRCSEFIIDIGDVNKTAFLYEPPCNCSANTLSRTGDDRNPGGQFIVHKS